jgi:type II secretory pathway pseudopilin PulG
MTLLELVLAVALLSSIVTAGGWWMRVATQRAMQTHALLERQSASNALLEAIGRDLKSGDLATDAEKLPKCRVSHGALTVLTRSVTTDIGAVLREYSLRPLSGDVVALERPLDVSVERGAEKTTRGDGGLNSKSRAQLTSSEASMHYFAFLTLSACTVLPFAAPQDCPPSTPTPIKAAGGQVSVDEFTHDVGEILRGETVTHTFRLTNTSATDITLFEIRVCCTCVSAAITIGEKRMTAAETAACKLVGTLKPEEHADLTLTLDTLDDGCGGKDGSILKSVRVYLSDRAASLLTLSVVGNLTTPYTLDPIGLRFGTVQQGQAATASSVLTGTQLGNFKVSKTQSPSDFVKVTVERVSESPTTPNSVRITAELLPSAPIANYQGRLVLELIHPSVRAIVVPLSVLVVARPEKD